MLIVHCCPGPVKRMRASSFALVGLMFWAGAANAGECNGPAFADSADADDDLEHAGQAAYIRGLAERRGLS